MSVLEKLAFSLGRRDEVPNRELAEELANNKDIAGVGEIVKNLRNKNKNIANDCIKVLYETGYINPEMIQDYSGEILQILKEIINGSNNRMIWGIMITLGLIAGRKPQAVMDNFDLICEAIEKGSVITIDNGIKTLALAAAAGKKYNEKIFP